MDRVSFDADNLLKRAKLQLADYDLKFRQFSDEDLKRKNAMQHVMRAMDEAISFATRVERFKEARNDDKKWRQLEGDLSKLRAYFVECKSRFESVMRDLPQELAERPSLDEDLGDHAGKGNEQGSFKQEPAGDSGQSAPVVDDTGGTEKQAT